jgi:DNA replication protein DnaC
VQWLQVARLELALESALARLDKYHLLILDAAYVSKDQAETSVLFELIGMRFERRSLLIPPTSRSANGARSSWSGHDPPGDRSPRPSLDHYRDERRELPSPSRN